MKPDKFAIELCKYIEHRVIEICKKFSMGNVNSASLYAFWIATQGDIQSFLKENKLEVRKRK